MKTLALPRYQQYVTGTTYRDSDDETETPGIRQGWLDPSYFMDGVVTD